MLPYPKIELHVHLEGTVRAHTLLEIARRNDYALPADTVEGLQELYRFTDFRHFIEVWILTTNALKQEEDYRQMVVDYAAEAASHGAVYLEGIFSPAERVRHGCSWEDVFEGVCNGAQEAKELHGVEIRLTPDIPRGFTQEEARETVEWCNRYQDRGVVGVGLGGLEAEFPPEPYEDVFAHAKSLGLGSVPHAGEVAGAASVRGALESLQADRLRHGIRAEEDPGLVRELAGRGTVLDVCPLSNLRTGAVALARRPPAAPPRRGRRPLQHLDRRPGDVRHRPHPRLRGGDLVRPRSALVLRGGRGRSPLRRGNAGPAPGRSATRSTGPPTAAVRFPAMAIAREAEPVGSLSEVREAGLDREDLLGIYRNMILTRGVEERGHILYQQGKIPGSFYTGRGNEAAAVGVATAMGARRRRHAAAPRHGRAHRARRRAVADPRAVHGAAGRADARPRRQRASRRRSASG